MSRRRRAVKRVILADPLFGSVMVSKFINCLMLDGKKSIAEAISYKALAIVVQRKEGGKVDPNFEWTEKLREKALDFFIEAVKRVTPPIRVTSRRVGGATYQVPSEVPPELGQALAFRWIIENARKRNEHDMHNKLAAEILDVLQDRGGSMKVRENTIKMAEANKAFAHLG